MTTDDMDDLPRALRVLWGEQGRRAQQALSLERIVDAGIAIADADGIGALSMARLAERLGCATMSLYRHVANKDELLVFMMDAAPGEPPPIEPGDWRAGLATWARALRSVYFAHPWILLVALGRPPMEPGQLAWMDRGLAALGGTGLSPQEQMATFMCVLNYVRGEAQITAVLMRGEPDVDSKAAQAEYGRVITRFVHADRFPALAKLSAAGVFTPAGDTERIDDFEFGLARILDGVATLIDR